MEQVLDPFTIDHPHEKVSKSYLFIPTAKVIEEMADHGWRLNSQAATKSKKFAGAQRHMARFRPMDPKNEIRIGDSVAELLMINSHNGSTSYRFSGGIWRIVCSNGLIVSELQFPGVVARHGGDLGSILEASLAVAERLPSLAEHVDRMKRTELNPIRRVEFARASVHARYDGKDVVDPKDLLKVNRPEDEPTDLWTTFNVVQENLSRGGQVGQVGDTGMFRRMRPMGGMDKTIAVNTALWDLAEAFAA